MKYVFLLQLSLLDLEKEHTCQMLQLKQIFFKKQGKLIAFFQYSYIYTLQL